MICDQCHKEILPGEPRYGVINRDDPKTGINYGRHWRCHTPIEEQFRSLRRDIADIKRIVEDSAKK